MREQLVAVEPPDDREDACHLGVGERCVQVRDPRSYRRGVEFVALVNVAAEGQAETQRGEALLDQDAVIVLAHEAAAAGRRHHSHGVAAAELTRDDRVGRCHQNSIVGRPLSPLPNFGWPGRLEPRSFWWQPPWLRWRDDTGHGAADDGGAS